MEGNIGVRMAGQCGLMGDFDAAQGHAIARHQRVDIIAIAGTQIRKGDRVGLRQQLVGMVKIGGFGDFDIANLSFNDCAGEAIIFGNAGIIGKVIPPLKTCLLMSS